MKKVIGPLTPADDLAYAAQLLAGRISDSLIVVRSRAIPEVLGTFTRRDLVIAYSKLLEKVNTSTAWGDQPPSG